MGRKPSVLVTGAAGYVGRLTIEALAARRAEFAAVVALDLKPPEAPEGVVSICEDILSPQLSRILEEHAITTVLHLASIVRTPKGAPKDLAYRVDVEGTRNLLRASVASGVTKLTVTSSGAAYGYHPDNPAWIDESTPLRGNDAIPYARHKRLVEEMLDAARKDLAILVFRPGTIIGRKTKSPVTDLFDGRFILGVMGSDSPFVFIHDEDLVSCLLAGVTSDKTGAYNVAGDGALTPREIAGRLGKRYLPLPAWLLKSGLALLHGLGLTSHTSAHIDFLRYRPVLSNRRLKEEFGFEPKLTSSEAFQLFVESRRT